MPNRNRRNTRKDRRNRKNRSRRDRGSRRSNRSRRNMVGGGQGAGWTIGAAVAPEAPYAATNQPYDACLGAPRPGQISYSDQGGLPGMGAPVMKGGGLSNIPPGPIMKEGYEGYSGESKPAPVMKGGSCGGGCGNPANGDLDKVPLMGVQSGGRYTFNLEAGDAQGFAQVDKVPCEPNWSNPLNKQSGGGSGGLANAADMGVYEAPTARYTTSPSQWTDSVGAPVLLNVPLDAKMWSRACTQTGGKRKGRKGARKALKGRKATRRNRKSRK